MSSIRLLHGFRGPVAIRWTCALALAVSLGCKYDPKFPEGTISCRTEKDCPPGFACGNSLCYGKNGGVDADAGGPDTPAADKGAPDIALDGLVADSSVSDGVGPDGARDVGNIDGRVPDVIVDGTSGADGGCPDACVIGDRRCGAGGLSTCVTVGACPTWSVEIPCTGRLTCQGTAPAAKCQCPPKPVGCEGGAGSACVNGVRKTCLVDTDSCVYEMALETCAATRPCLGNFPNAACTCPAPPTICGGQAGTNCATNQTVVACAPDSAGCLAAGATITCPTGKPCTGAAPSANCSCGPPPPNCAAGAGKSCVAGQIVTCDLDMMSGCLVITNTASCAAGLTCQGTAPNASCACPAVPPECVGGVGTVCQGAGGFVTCARDTNGCLVSRGTTACASGKQCTGSPPSATCTCPAPPANCQAGVGLLCNIAGALVRCDNDPVSGCLTVISTTTCPTGMQCAGSFPAASCMCPTVPPGCAGGVGKSCSNGNVVTCTRPTGMCFMASTTTCPATKPCGGSFPTADCTCPASSCASAGSSCSGNNLVTCTADVNMCLQSTPTSCTATSRYCTGAAPGAVCAAPTSLGFPTDLTSMSTKATGFLSGQSIMVASPTIIRSFGLISRQAGTTIAVGLYSDVAGNPSALIAKAEFQPVAVGRNEYVAAPATTGGTLSLSAGTYWIMALYDLNTSIAAAPAAGPLIDRRVIAAGFGSLPLTLTGVAAQPQLPATNYYILVAP